MVGKEEKKEKLGVGEQSGCEGCGGGDCVYGKLKLWGICLGELGYKGQICGVGKARW